MTDEKKSETKPKPAPKRDAFTVNHYEAKVLEVLMSIDASLKTIASALPKPQGDIPFMNPTTFEPKEPQ